MPDLSRDTLHVSEMFYSIQGESTRAGFPCAFIRLCGCNLRCSYCDSSYTWEETGQIMPLEPVYSWLAGFPHSMVEITGGEPLLQEGIYPLMEQLLAQGREVLLETSGSLSIAQVPVAVGVILDLKCPDSGMVAQNHWQNVSLLQQRQAKGSQDEIKFVLSSKEDVAWAMQIIQQYNLTELVPVLFSPIIGQLTPEWLAQLILREQLAVRLQLQLHTQIWPHAGRGV